MQSTQGSYVHTPPGAALELSLTVRTGTQFFAMTDHGPGIPATELPRLFERFHRGRGARAGAGLGLALCRKIAARHGGTVEVRSTVDAGTCVTVALPRAEAEM